MFNVKHWIESVLDWLDLPIDPQARSLLDRYGDWLVAEALPAGGLGPREAGRIGERHLADALAFAAGFPSDPRSVIDVGSGVGLPGLPLAIVFPQVSFTLLDRSGRRVELAARAVRVLGLDNVVVVEGDLTSWEGSYDVVVARAVMAPAALVPHIERLLAPGGYAVIALSRGADSSPDREIARRIGRGSFEVEIIEVPVLDSPATLLRMTRE
jgi:16S rRNA (guanine527-N7)-methyltransferase